MDFNNLTKLSTEINALNKAINFYADIFSSAEIYATDKKGNIVENDELVEKLLNPNSLQDFKEFSKEFIRNYFSGGYAYITPYHESAGFEKKLNKASLFVLNNDFISFNNGKASYQINEKYDISKSTLFIDILRDPENPMKGISRVNSLQDEIQIIKLSDKAKQNQTKLSGHTIVSPKNNTSQNSYVDNGLDQIIKSEDGKQITEKQDIESKLNLSGLAQDKSITVASKELTAVNLMEGLKDYNFSENKLPEEKAILNLYNIPREFQNLASNDVSKYENRQNAMLEVLQNTIEPLANSFAYKIQKHFDHENIIYLSYKHLPVYAIIENRNEEKKDKIVNRVISLLNSQLISTKEANKILEENEII